MGKVKITCEEKISEDKVVRIELEMPTQTEEKKEEMLMEETFESIVKMLVYYFAGINQTSWLGVTAALTLLEMHVKRAAEAMNRVLKDKEIQKKIEEEIVLSPSSLTKEELEAKIEKIVEGKYRIKIE